VAKTFQLYVTVIRWIDGDSFVGALDQGRYVWYGTDAKPRPFRCAIINAPELKVDGVDNPAGLAALDYARSLCPPAEYRCLSTGLDEFGRPLLDLFTERGMFSEVMLGSGNAVPYRR
jgi:endonuclease YncB( thermonuclease family)